MKLLFAALVSLAILAPAASAGEFHVYSCRTPDGEAAPVDGWSGGKSGLYTWTTDTCPEGGSLMAALGDEEMRLTNADSATWTFTPPSDDWLSSALVWRAGDADGGGSLDAMFGLWFATPLNQNNPANAFGQCTGGAQCPAGIGNTQRPLAAENEIAIPRTGAEAQVFANVSCFGAPGYECPAGQGDANNYAAVIYLYAADLTLEQTAGPSASNVGGELASAPSIAGTSDVTFAASDPGAGVYEAVFTVDGQVVQRSVIDEDGGRCRDVGQTSDGLPAFLYLQPCPASVSGDVGFDTTRVANGVHHLVVSVVDAAGNSAPVLDRTVTVANPGVPGPLNGQGATTQAVLSARWQRTAGALLTSGYGAGQQVDGRLVGPGGAPISGAAVEVSATPSYTGAATAAQRSVTTGSNGGFSLRVPAASSRSLTFAYRARIGDAAPAATRTLRLAVRAPVSLRIVPRTAYAGSTIHFSGRLAGEPVPRGGKAVVLEARSGGGRWLEFDVIRSDGRGRFHASYTFRFPGPADYQFRVLCEAEADYPYARGVSPVVAVFER